MNEQQEFDERFADSLRALRRDRGACPDAETLGAYQLGELPLEDVVAVRNHVERCGTCDALLERARPLLEKQALPQRLLPRRFLTHPALPYIAMVVLAYPAWRGLTLGTVAPAQPSIEPVQRIDLSVERGIAPRPAPANSPTAKLALAFFVPTRVGAAYSVSIVSGVGKVVASQTRVSSNDGRGEFEIVCDRRLFPPGEYTLLVTETDARSGAFLREVRFPFAL